MTDTRSKLVADMQRRIKERGPDFIKTMKDLINNPEVSQELRDKARKDLQERGLWSEDK
ncbi:hypothetical protein IS360_003606 [Salmonella enterica]|nr:hypothetical protein [Salmonella enterica]